ncbi:MAG: hypothetical protein AAFU71_06835 [Cyanobacteria bacterium J06632_22]
MPHKIERIVCLSATGLDILLELGLEPIGYVQSEPIMFMKRNRTGTGATEHT